MSGQCNKLLGASGDVTHFTSSSGSPIVVELDSDSSDEDVEVSGYTGYERIRNNVRLSSPPETIDLASLDGMECEDDTVRRHALSPLPSTSAGTCGKTHPILESRTIMTSHIDKNHEDRNATKLENAETRIRKMEEETKKLNEELSFLKQRAAETEDVLTGRDEEIDQGRREICTLHQRLEKSKTTFEEKNKEAEQLKQELVIYKADIESKLKERVIQQEKLDEVTKQLRDRTEELNSIKTKFEEEKVRCLDIQKSAKEEQRWLLARQQEMEVEITTKLEIMGSRINELQNLSSQTKSDLRKKRSVIETKQQELKLFFSKFKQKEKELEKDLETKNGMLEKVVEEKAELERRCAVYHDENERLRFQFKNLVEIKQKCEELQLLLNFPVEPTAAAGTSDEPVSAVTFNNPSSTNRPENSMNNQNNDSGINTVLSNDSHEVATESIAGSLTATLSRPGIDSFTPNNETATKRWRNLHKVDYSARDKYRCVCGKELVSLLGLVYHVYGKMLKIKFDNKRSSGFVTKSRMDYHKKTCPSDQSTLTPNADERIGVKRKRNHLPDDDEDIIPSLIPRFD